MVAKRPFGCYNIVMKKIDVRKLFYPELKKNLIVLGTELLFVGLYLAVDLLTKHFVYMPIAAGADDVIVWNGVLRYTAVENTGASFGLFSDSFVALTVVSFVTVIALLLVLVFSVKVRNGWLRAALILMIAGGLGNLVDRFMFGYVRDWIYFELIDFAVFNLADSGLTVGCVLLLIFVVFFYRPEDKKKDTEAGDAGEQ